MKIRFRVLDKKENKYYYDFLVFGEMQSNNLMELVVNNKLYDYVEGNFVIQQFVGTIYGNEIYSGTKLKIKSTDYYSNVSFSADEDWSFVGIVKYINFSWNLVDEDSLFIPLSDIEKEEMNMEIIDE